MKRSYFIFFLLFVFNTNATRSRFLFGRQEGGNLLLNKNIKTLVKDTRAITTEWLTQKLDHFNASVNTTWNQKYFTNDEFFKSNSNGPVFLFIDGEGAAEITWMKYGAWYEAAREHKALMFQLEHRFYGDSHPTDDLSLPNLQYLTSEQALGDLAEFITQMNMRYGFSQDVKWIAFGGSYSGSLAAWLRLTYPNLVYGAVSSSGPLLAVVDFDEYFKTVGDSLATYSEECRQTVKDGFAQLESLIESGKSEDLNTINEVFNLCSPIQTKVNNTNELAIFFQGIANEFASVVQYNGLTTTNIDDLCEILIDTSIGDPMKRLSQIVKLLTGSCYDTSYEAEVKLFKDENYGTGMWRQWIFQTCHEFGFFQTSSNQDHVFGHHHPVELFINLCKDGFSSEYDAKYLDNVTANTNSIYGGKDIIVSNVVFVHGSIDPWHPLGVTETTNEDAPAIYINGTSHCNDMYATSATDLPQLTEARKQIRQSIATWLAN